MHKLNGKENFAADLMDQLRGLPSRHRDQILSRGWSVCELTWEDEKSLDAGRLDVRLAENVCPEQCQFRGQVKNFGLFKTRPMERVLSGLIEQAWLHCVVHNRSARKSEFPNQIVVRFG